MRYLSLFSGIEAATEAWHPLGWEAAAFCEFDDFPSAVLAYHHPKVPNFGDVSKITEQQIINLGQVDVVVFGSPCQDLSVAGKGKGFDGERSGLFRDAIRIVQWCRKHCGARFALWENVPGAFSSNKGRDFAQVVSEMAGLKDVNPPQNGWGKEGAAVGDNGLLEWSVLDAQWFGLAQRRKRVFALVDFGNWADRPPILLERESLRGDSAPSREKKENITPITEACSSDSGSTGLACNKQTSERCFADKPNIKHMASNDNDVIGALCARNYKGVGNQFVQEGKIILERVSFKKPEEPQELRASGGNFGGGSENLVVAFTQNQRNEVRELSVVGALSAQPGSKQQTYLKIKSICFDCKSSATHMPIPTVEKTHTLRSMNGKKNNDGGHLAVMTNSCGHRMEAFGQYATDETASTMKARDYKDATDLVTCGVSVRRLTPVECARLQGFPDNHVNIPWKGKEHAPDGHQYKAYGNSMAVPVMNWIGRSIDNAVTRGQVDLEDQVGKGH